jgi:hypothetical protein
MMAWASALVSLIRDSAPDLHPLPAAVQSDILRILSEKSNNIPGITATGILPLTATGHSQFYWSSSAKSHTVPKFELSASSVSFRPY